MEKPTKDLVDSLLISITEACERTMTMAKMSDAQNQMIISAVDTLVRIGTKAAGSEVGVLAAECLFKMREKGKLISTLKI